MFVSSMPSSLSGASLGVRHPLWRAAPALPLTGRKALKHGDRSFNLAQFCAEIRQTFSRGPLVIPPGIDHQTFLAFGT
jgi:hypothetical protein